MDIDTNFGLNSYLNYSFKYTTNVNTAIAFTPFQLNDNGNVNGFDDFDGSNVPIGIGVLKAGETSQLLESYGLSQSKFFNYGRPGDSWWKSSLFEIEVNISPMPSAYRDYKVLINPSDSIASRVLTAFSYSSTISIGDEFEAVNMAYIPAIYICPVYAYAISSSAYEPIQQLLLEMKWDSTRIASYLSQLSQQPTSEQFAWLNEYQRKSQDAIAKASSMAAAAHYDFSKPDIDSGDLSQYINGTEVRPFTTLLSSFLSHSKILIILTVAITASIIGYIFFGKRG